MFPIIIRRALSGANGRNWPGVVLISPDAPLPAAVLAQEAWEAMHKLNPINMIRVRLSRRARRRMEIMGHEVEVQAAALIYGESVEKTRYREISAMLTGYGDLFAGRTRGQLRAAMESVSDDASRWVRRRRNKIERWK